MLIVFFFLLWLHKHRRFSGQVILFYALLYSVIRFCIEFLRDDPRGDLLGLTTLTGLSTSQIISLIFGTGALVMLIVRWRRAAATTAPMASPRRALPESGSKICPPFSTRLNFKSRNQHSTKPGLTQPNPPETAAWLCCVKYLTLLRPFRYHRSHGLDPPGHTAKRRAARAARAAMDNLQYIRETMERATAFTGISGRGQVAIGITALATALISAQQKTFKGWLMVWVAEAVIALLIAGWSMDRKARAQRCRCSQDRDARSRLVCRRRFSPAQ